MSILVLTYKDEFLHTVTIVLIPITLKSRIASHHLHEFFLRHSSIENACLLEIELLARLLEEIAHIVLLLEIAHTLATDNTLIPMTCYKLVETVKTERFTAIIHESGYSILITMVMVVMMTAAMPMLMITMRVIFVLVVVIFMLVVGCIFYLTNPCG